jgi:hypothetical protein
MANFEQSEFTDSLVVSEDARRFLLETTRWAKFLAILGFVGIGLIVVVAIALMTVGGALFGEAAGNPFGALGGAAIGGVYLVLGALYFFPVYYLYQAATKLRNGLDGDDQGQLTLGFENLKSHYKFLGIMALVMLGLYGIIFVFTIVGAAFM